MANNIKVGIQGIEASFHDMASRRFFNGTPFSTVECSTFHVLCDKLHDGTLDYAVMAIENTLAGSLLPNYLLLEKYRFQIIGEAYLRIALNLMALPGQTIEELKFVQSHPMALHQSMDFLNQYPFIKLLEVEDTAESARAIRSQNLSGYGAIASSLAAEKFGLDILASEIESNVQNYTRFLILKNPTTTNEMKGNKASINFKQKHEPGSLVEILKVFADHHINLSKIQSVPVVGKPYEYSFQVDLEWNDFSDYEQAMDIVQQKVISLTHFGIYQKGEKPTA